MERKRIATCLVAALVFVAAVATAVVAFGTPPGWQQTQLTFPPGNNDGPHVSGDRVAWYGSGVTDWQVFTWKAGDSSPTTITSDAHDHNEPNLSGDRIVWTWYDDSFHYQIVTWKVGDSSPTTLTSDATDHGQPRVSGDRVVWGRQAFPSGLQIFTWKHGDASPTTLTTDPSRDPQVSGDRVVWTGLVAGHWQIFMWKAGDSSPTQLTSGAQDHEFPQVSGDRVVWVAFDGVANNQIVTWKAGDSSPTTLTSDAREHEQPQVSGDRVVWLGDDGAAYQVFTWKAGDGTPTQLTFGGVEMHDAPQVSGDRAVWNSHDGANWQIVTWKAGDVSPTPLTSDPHDHYRPGVSGDRVVWTAVDDELTQQIFTAVTTPTGLTKPSVSPSKPRRNKNATFRASLTAGASAGGTTKLYLYHRETKTVRKKVRGRWRRVRVKYWKLRKTVTLRPAASGSSALSAKAKLKYKGSWKMYAAYSGWSGYLPSTSPSRTFTVR